MQDLLQKGLKELQMMKVRFFSPMGEEVHFRGYLEFVRAYRTNIQFFRAASNGREPVLPIGPVSGGGRHVGRFFPSSSGGFSLASLPSLATSVLTRPLSCVQGKEKGNSGDIARQKDTG